MNIFSALLDTMASFVRNNPLTVVVIVMLAVFVPSLFGALLIGALILVLLLVAWPVIMLFRLRRMGRRIEEEAARKACLHDAVMRMPLRYDTRVGADGVGLSRGQMQRILIARAIYRNPEYIFLDEATNSLDATNERAIVEGLAEFYEGRTVVIVAHRLSTVRNADNIVVLSGGRIVEQGTHDALVAARGSYYTLIKNQLELG